MLVSRLFRILSFVLSSHLEAPGFSPARLITKLDPANKFANLSIYLYLTSLAAEGFHWTTLAKGNVGMF